MKAWFISDIHIKDINERNSIKLLRFLSELKAQNETADTSDQSTHLFLLGDIFDQWVGSSEYFGQKFEALTHALLDLKKQGVDVRIFEGNHDFQIKAFWEKVGIPVEINDAFIDLGPWKVHLEHGDYINPNDLTYIKYRNFTKTKAMKRLTDLIPGFVIDAVGDFASRRSRKKSSVYRKNRMDELISMIRVYAQTQWRKRPFDWIITGHMHARDQHTFTTGNHTYHSVNLGSWFEQPAAFCLTPEKGEFHNI